MRFEMQNTVQWKARHSYVVLAFLLIIIVLVLAGCASSRRAQEERGTVSAGNRAGVTAVVDGDRSSTTRGAIISAVAGGVTGAIIGRQMDQQTKEIEQRVSGATVERIGEGIEVTFASELLYDVGADQLRPAGQQNLRDLATTFDRYRDTDLLIVAHTDSAGSESDNQALSERRARSVRDFLIAQGVLGGRLRSAGRGGREPLSPRVTDDGQHPNQRVEVAIFASPSYRNELSKQRNTR
jgi:outer membrane protein OmpA-like peptidoglycan-associated protein